MQGKALDFGNLEMTESSRLLKQSKSILEKKFMSEFEDSEMLNQQEG